MAIDVVDCEAAAGEDSACASANRFHSVRAFAPGHGAPECGSIPETSPEISSSSSKRKGRGGPRPNSGGARPNSGGPRPNSGGKRANSGGPRPNSGGKRPGGGRKRKVVWAAVQPPQVEGGAWFAVRYEPGCDLLTINRLMALGVEVLALMHQPDPKRPAVPALPGYMFARLDMGSPNWRELPAVLRECRARLLGEDGEHPRPIPDAQIERLRRSLDGPDKAAKLERLAKGARVRVVGGLLGQDIGEGVVEWANGREARVRFASGPLRIARPALELVG